MTLYLVLRVRTRAHTHACTHTHLTPQTHNCMPNPTFIPFPSHLLYSFELHSLSVRYGCNAVKILILLHNLTVLQHANSLLTV